MSKIHKALGKSKRINNYGYIKRFTDDFYHLVVFKRDILRENPSKGQPAARDIHDFKLDTSLSRARSSVFEYAICNHWDYFITLTLDKKKMDRYDLDHYIKRLGQFIRNYKKKTGADIKYLLVPETHKDGAWHLHGLIKGVPANDLTMNSNGYLHWEPYFQKFGYCSLDRIRSQIGVSKYITKYVTKTLKDENVLSRKNKKLYYASRGLEKASKIYEGTISANMIPPATDSFSNDYITIYEMNKNTLTVNSL